ncbi:MAG: uracil-DNA glycosylase [Bacteroidia bacterium]|nr:uracil-DNA glycosylase [Bacteroidia bacterium]
MCLIGADTLCEGWEDLDSLVIQCRRCSRLVAYREGISPPRRFSSWEYWSKAVPGFGDRKAHLWIVGLAPAAHGANRTGRMFTGDSSGDWLYRALYETGYANQPTSSHRADGLYLKGAYVSAAIRCAPPQNKPTPAELLACFPYLATEYQLMKESLRVIIPLGHIAYRQVQRLFPKERFPAFRHGELYLVESIYILASYHPSQQNTRTGRLKWSEWIRIFEQARALCESSSK